MYEQLKEAQKRETAWARGRKDAKTWFVSALQAYDLGTLETRELVDSLRAYFSARSSHVDAINKLNTAVAELERVTGAAVVDTHVWDARCDE